MTTRPHYRHQKARPILHVHIVDDTTGEQLADVDAASTADGLAYYLRSRHIDDEATEASVVASVSARHRGRRIREGETLVVEHRSPFTGALELALSAHVEGECR